MNYAYEVLHQTVKAIAENSGEPSTRKICLDALDVAATMRELVAVEDANLRNRLIEAGRVFVEACTTNAAQTPQP